MRAHYIQLVLVHTRFNRQEIYDEERKAYTPRRQHPEQALHMTHTMERRQDLT
jgi:hypothetical protein